MRTATLVLLTLALLAPHVAACDTSLSAVNVSCIQDRNCSFHGRCDASSGVCVCDTNYITYNNAEGVGCNYNQKKQLVAFLLSFFVGYTGAEHFYLGNLGVGAGKLVYVIAGCILVALLQCVVKDSKNGELVFVIAKVLYYIGCFVWVLYDLITIGQCSQLDGNGAPLVAW